MHEVPQGEDGQATQPCAAAGVPAVVADEQVQSPTGMTEAEWRQELTVGSLVDIFDGAMWCEGIVCAVGSDAPPAGLDAAPQAPEAAKLGDPAYAISCVSREFTVTGDESLEARHVASSTTHNFVDCLTVRVRREVGCLVETHRRAGMTGGGATNDDDGAVPFAVSFAVGALSKPFSYVSDWRSQLRQGMKVRLLEEVEVCVRVLLRVMPVYFSSLGNTFGLFMFARKARPALQSRRGHPQRTNVSGALFSDLLASWHTG